MATNEDARDRAGRELKPVTWAARRTGLLRRLDRICQYRPRLYDVVFYTPAIGRIVAGDHAAPPGGAETQILMLARALSQRGIRVAIIVFETPGLPGEVDGISLVPRRQIRRRRIVGKLLEGVAIWQALWRVPSRAIVCRGAGIALGLLAVYSRFSRRRLVFSTASVVDFDWHCVIPKRRDQVIYEFGIQHADAIVVQSEEQVELCLEGLGRRPALIKSLASLKEPQTQSPEAFLWVGRLVSYKRPLAYIQLARELPEARFWMVGVPTQHLAGDDTLAKATVAAARELPNLELLPPRSHAGIQDLMSRAVASVNTADFEGMPNVLLEAWSKGVPSLVLTHDPGGVVVAHGLGGFASGSVEMLVALAREQWANRHHRSEVSYRCREYIAKNHTPSVIAAQWLNTLDMRPVEESVEKVAPVCVG